MLCGQTSQWTIPSGLPSGTAAAVRVGQPPRHPRRDEDRQIQRRALFQLGVEIDEFVKRYAVHIFDHEIVDVVEAVEMVDLHDILVNQVRDELRLADEIPDIGLAVRKFVPHHLDCDDLLEPGHADLPGFEDRPHAALGDEVNEFIPFPSLEHPQRIHAFSSRSSRATSLRTQARFRSRPAPRSLRAAAV